MAGFTIYSLLILGTGLAVLGSQHSPYSLQAAIDALHRREAQLALREEAAAEQMDEDGYWMEPTEEQQQQFRPNRQRLNRILANYLRRDDDPEDGYDPYDLDTRKRSVFRERDGELRQLGGFQSKSLKPPLSLEQSTYPTVFRERELEKSYAHPDLSADFLRAVDRQAVAEREEEFQDRLQQLWDKYQQEENEIEQRLFDDEPLVPLAGPGGYEKRQGFPMSESEPSPAHYGPPMQERKRTLPILPWLPATRKKRFPVAKRSPKPETAPSGTDEKVAKDLQALFGAPIEQKRKRSSEPASAPPSSTVSTGVSTTASTTTERALEANKAKRDSSDEHHEHSSEEGPDDDEHEHDHEHDHDHEDSSEEFEGEDDDKKKKRSVRKRSNLEVVKEDQILPGDIGEFKSKKSIQWNKYFGMDRRKKDGRSGAGNGPVPYPLSFYKTYDEDRKKKNINQDKLESMAQKLKSIEDLILDQTVKYTGDHEGLITEPDELEKLKDKLVARLATAYSIEKMRHTLERLKDSVSDDQLKLNEVEPEQPREEKEKAKRVAVKKERAEYDHSQHSMEGNEKVAHEEVENNLDDVEGDKKKKKRTQKRYQEIFRSPEEPELDDEFSRGLVVESTECPLLDAFERRCRGVDVLSGDIYQELLPACGAHQLCYLCGVSPKVCDLQYLSEADNICENQPDCQTTARSVLMILRGFPGPQLGPRECAKNPCLYRAMVEVGVVVN
uniref:Uncharacterized protein n=1 Tax=Anopheles culicifacies TaxID=139723 RepID=A0A182MP81_9DIPT